MYLKAPEVTRRHTRVHFIHIRQASVQSAVMISFFRPVAFTASWTNPEIKPALDRIGFQPDSETNAFVNR
jgi:hypothetical protein